MRIPAIAVFDAGKTNKKLLVFDGNYRILDEHACRLPEIKDEDGNECEDVDALTRWVRSTLATALSSPHFQVKAVNFTSYGASFVHLDAQGKVSLPLYNYLKPYPPEVLSEFFAKYGGEEKICRETASPLLGHLNSGLLLYRLKKQKPGFTSGGYSLHLPQYLCYAVTGKAYSDITSIGCHTMLWDFTRDGYHSWVTEEGLLPKLAPLVPADHSTQAQLQGRSFKAGPGVHDSSSALIPYLSSFSEPFMLLSTGTWSITLNPFNNAPLTSEELKNDCLCYLTYKGIPVKASRLFAGHMHEEGVKRLNAHFHVQDKYFQSVKYDPSLLNEEGFVINENFLQADLSHMTNYDTAYHNLVANIVALQVRSTNLVSSSNVQKLFVDGGFSRNHIYMNLLAKAYPNMTVYAASVAQATALGAALAMHHIWNKRELPGGLVELSEVRRSE